MDKFSRRRNNYSFADLGIGVNTALQGRMVHFHLQSGLAHHPVVSACEAMMNIDVFVEGLAFLD
jgi:hypothetical protein